jgi:hypothetical protein
MNERESASVIERFKMAAPGTSGVKFLREPRVVRSKARKFLNRVHTLKATYVIDGGSQ